MVTGDQLKSVLASPVFSELVAKDMDEISGMLECCTAEAGDSLRRVGDESSSLEVVLSSLTRRGAKSSVC